MKNPEIYLYDNCRAPWLLPATRRSVMLVLRHMLDAADAVGRGLDALEVYLVNDGISAQINRRHLHCTGPTNIISFPSAEGGTGILCLSLDCLFRECLLYGQNPEEHLIRLLAHGLGHLAGFDHGDEMDIFCAEILDAAMRGSNGND